MHPREIAARKGERFYSGGSCKNCGATKRHTINASCIACSNKLAKINVTKRRKKIKQLLAQSSMG